MSDIYFFVHIPRTAGSTVRDALFYSFLENQIYQINGWSEAQFLEEAYAIKKKVTENMPKCIMGHFDIFINDFFNFDDKKVKYITFIREPIARVVSLYKFMKLSNKFNLKDMNFSDFIRMPKWREDLSNVQARYLGYHDINNITNYKLIDLLSSKKLILGFTDDMQQAKKKLSEELKINVNFKHLNNTIADDRFVISDEDLVYLYQLNQLDLHMYSFLKKNYSK